MRSGFAEGEEGADPPFGPEGSPHPPEPQKAPEKMKNFVYVLTDFSKRCTITRFWGFFFEAQIFFWHKALEKILHRGGCPTHPPPSAGSRPPPFNTLPFPMRGIQKGPPAPASRSEKDIRFTAPKFFQKGVK